MERLRQLIHEIHRRSPWQVLGIYVVASWGVLSVAPRTKGVGLDDPVMIPSPRQSASPSARRAAST